MMVQKACKNLMSNAASDDYSNIPIGTVKLPKISSIDFLKTKTILQPHKIDLTLEKERLENEIHGKLTFEKLCGNFMPLI